MSVGKTMILGVMGLVTLIFVWYAMDMFKKEHTEELSTIPQHIVESDKALGTDDVVALLSFDKASFESYQLGISFDEFIHHPAIKVRPWGMLLRAAVSGSNKLNSLASGLYPDHDDADALEPVFVAHGEFDMAALKNMLLTEYEGQEKNVGKFGVIDFSMVNIDSCEKSPVLRTHISNNKIIIGSPHRVTVALKRLEQTAPPSKQYLDMGRWQAFQQGKLFSVWLRKEIVPASRIANTGVWKLPTQYTYETLEGFRDLYFAIDGSDKRKRASILAEAQANEMILAAKKYAFWVDFLKQNQQKIQKVLPTVAEVINWIEIENQSDIVRLKAHIDRETVANLKNLPEDLNRLFGSGDRQGYMQEVAVSDEIIEIIDNDPFIFRPSIEEDAIASYNEAEAPTPANAVLTGPFSVFVESANFDPDGGEKSIEIRSVGYKLPNIGNNHGKVKILIDKVSSKDGKTVVMHSTCGENRINRPELFKRTEKNNYIANKKLLLSQDAGIEHLSKISGVITAKIPQQIDIYDFTVRGGSARSEKYGDLEFKLLSGSSSGLTYEIVGNIDRLVDIRGLNRNGKHIQIKNAAQYVKGASLKGDVLGGNINFYGLVDSIQIVLAAQHIEKTYPFELTRFDQFYPNTYSMVKAPTKLLLTQQELERGKVICPEAEVGKSNAQAGPFCVQLTQIAQRDGLWMNFVVNIARVPMLEDSFPFVELRLNKAVLHNEQVVDLHQQEDLVSSDVKETLSSKLAFAPPWDTDRQLMSQVLFSSGVALPLNALRELHGELKISLPKKISVVTLNSTHLGESVTNGVFDATLISKSVDGEKIRINKGSNDLLHMVPRDKQGRPIKLDIIDMKDEGSEGIVISFKTGDADKIDFHVIKEREEVLYPVELL